MLLLDFASVAYFTTRIFGEVSKHVMLVEPFYFSILGLLQLLFIFTQLQVQLRDLHVCKGGELN